MQNKSSNLKKEISGIVNNISEQLQTIEKKLLKMGITESANLNIRFPRGFIRTTSYYKEKYSCLCDGYLLDNVAYSLQLTDVFRWILNRTDLDLTAKEMLIKNGIILISSVLEGICYCQLKLYKIQPHSRFSKNIKKIRENVILDDEFCNSLDKVRNMRKNIHLQILNSKEYKKYTLKDYNFAIQVLHRLKEKMEIAF